MKHLLPITTIKYVVLSLFFVLQTHAQTGNFTGEVFLEGMPMQGVEIYTDTTPKIGTITSNEGRFMFKNLKEGTYTFYFTHIMAVTKQKNIRIEANQTKNIRIDLLSDTKLNEVVVSASLKPVKRVDTPIAVEVYAPTFFKKNPTPSVFDALEQVNGVRPQLNCGLCNTGDIHINGLEGPYTFVLIDGMPIVSGLSTVYGLSGIPNALIERVEVVKGPASSLYGSEAVAGLINIITKKNSNAPSLSIDSYSTSWNERNLDLGSKFQLRETTILLGVNYYNFSEEIDKNNDGYTDLALQHRISVFNKWNFNRASKKAFSVAGRYFYEDRSGGQLGWNSDTDRGQETIYGESIYTARGELFGIYEFKGKENLDLSFSANLHDQNSYYGTTLYDAQQYIGFVQFKWQRNYKKHDLLTGFATRYTYYNDNTPATIQVDETIIPSIFFQDEIEFSKKHKLLLGVRQDYDKRHGAIFTPRLAYRFAPRKKDVFRFNLGSGFRVVNLFTEEHAALSGSREVVVLEDLNPERSWSANFNYLMKRYLPSGAFFNIELSSWYTHFSNKIVPDYDTDSSLIIYQNSNGYALSRGVSLQSDFQFTNGLQLNLGVTLQEVLNVENEQKEQQILTEKFSTNLTASYPIRALNLNIDYTGSLYGPMRLPTFGSSIDARPEYAPYWGTHNIQLTYKGIDHLEIYGGVKNLLDWTPAKDAPFVISRGNDPFEQLPKTPENPLDFDTTYVYTSMQGIRGFFGIRYKLF